MLALSAAPAHGSGHRLDLLSTASPSCYSAVCHHPMRLLSPIFPLGLLAAPVLFAHQALTPSFPPFDLWRAAVLSGNRGSLERLYTTSPQPHIVNMGDEAIPLQEEFAFWSGWKAKGLTDISPEIVRESDPQPNVHVFAVQLTLTLNVGASVQKQHVSVVQGWVKQGDQWLLGFTQRTKARRLVQPLDNKEIYRASANPASEIVEAIHSATASHKRILLVFGGNWCFDCHVLDEAFHSPEIAPTLNQSFLVVHVDIAQMDKNLDVAKKYDVPLDQGVPAIAVLDSDGILLFSQKRGEFQDARSMAPEDILAFLRRWQPPH